MNTVQKLKRFSVITVTGVFTATSTFSGHATLVENDNSSIGVTAPSGSVFIEQQQQVNDPLIELAFGNSATAAIIRPLRASVAECQSVGAEYAASCAAAAYKKAAAAASRPDYRDARKILRDTAKKLDRLVSKNADRSAPKKKSKGGTYKAVKKEAVAKVNREAIKIIQEAETKLLRSSGSGDRKVHYQKIAQAVGSTKVIFRS